MATRKNSQSKGYQGKIIYFLVDGRAPITSEKSATNQTMLVSGVLVSENKQFLNLEHIALSWRNPEADRFQTIPMFSRGRLNKDYVIGMFDGIRNAESLAHYLKS